MAKHITPESSHRAVYRRAQDLSRSARGIIARLTPRALLIAALILSLGVWTAIGLAATSLVKGVLLR
jgi:hypothetical protein